MDIIRVEYSKIKGPHNDGVRVIFTYDNDEGLPLDIIDVYDVNDEKDAATVMGMIASRPNPAHLLVALRDITNISVH